MTFTAKPYLKLVTSGAVMSQTISDPLTAEASRRSLFGAAALLAGLATASQAPAQVMAVKPGRPETQNRTSLHQEVTFAAAPARVYAALLSTKDFTAFSGFPATIDPKAGGAVSLFGGQIVGRNIELVSNQRIVQAWRAVEDFPPGVYSLVKFELALKGGGTLLKLDHTGFPPGHFDHLNAGWGAHYWGPMKKFLA
jgi:activator of HSP90 ATPase